MAAARLLKGKRMVTCENRRQCQMIGAIEGHSPGMPLGQALLFAAAERISTEVCRG